MTDLIVKLKAYCGHCQRQRWFSGLIDSDYPNRGVKCDSCRIGVVSFVDYKLVNYSRSPLPDCKLCGGSGRATPIHPSGDYDDKVACSCMLGTTVSPNS